MSVKIYSVHQIVKNKEILCEKTNTTTTRESIVANYPKSANMIDKTSVMAKLLLEVNIFWINYQSIKTKLRRTTAVTSKTTKLLLEVNIFWIYYPKNRIAPHHRCDK